MAPSQEKKLLEIKQLLQRETAGGPSPPEATPTTPMTPAPEEMTFSMFFLLERKDFSTRTKRAVGEDAKYSRLQ